MIFDDKVFLSACYGVVARLSRYVAGNNHKINRFMEQKWAFKERMDCHKSTPFSHKGFICGIHGRAEHHTELRCIKISYWKAIMEQRRSGNR